MYNSSMIVIGAVGSSRSFQPSLYISYPSVHVKAEDNTAVPLTPEQKNFFDRWSNLTPQQKKIIDELILEFK
jgi:hypothetical protein